MGVLSRPTPLLRQAFTRRLKSASLRSGGTELAGPADPAHDEDVRRLSGGAGTGYRSTDHSGEIAWLRLQAVTAGVRRDELAYLVAAELLQSHDETGSSLDHWDPCRAFVELLLGHEILENYV